MLLPTFTIAGSPRTKKTSSRVVQCGDFTKVLPSAAHQRWFADAMQQAPQIRRRILSFGHTLPVLRPVAVKALFYRRQSSGDLTGFLQALGDFLQAPRQHNGRTTRNGAGIIDDDKQIQSWDGSRLLKDAAFPRIEVSIEVIE